MPEKAASAGLYRNTVSYFGMLVTLLGAGLTLGSNIVALSLKKPSPYLGIFSFMIFPAIAAAGVAIILYGMWRESRRRRRLGTTESLPYPRLDLNDVHQRQRFAYLSVGGVLLSILLAFGGYNTFLFTESNTFCGKLCHSVMEPEYAAYQHSPHARVHCVDCHVGSGASFYVKSKLSGVRQVFATVLNTYERPIPTPIANLRPARETCEECHWPNKFYGAQLLQIPYFRYDEKNTSDQISFMVKTGGGTAKLGRSAGIHWHMIIENSITYAARDPQHQDIPWFKVTGHDGQVREYMSLDNPVTPEELARLPKQTMDCISCHNRPTHIYPPPDRAVDLAMQRGSVPSDIPWIKKVTAEALMHGYPDNKTARKEIRERISSFYAQEYPELARERSQELDRVLSVAIDIYDHSVFPHMNVDWTTYPDNIGHRNWPGCFRCHEGRHATADGKVLTHECTVCHTMPQRGPIEILGDLPPITNEDWHPFPLVGKHGELSCTRCHSAGMRPTGDCRQCHEMPEEAPMADMACEDCHSEAPKRLPVVDCTDCHDEQGGLHTNEAHVDAGCNECHKPHGWSVAERETCLDCHGEPDEHEDMQEEACASCHDFTAD